MIKGKEDAANNYARGHYTVGKQLVEDVLDKVRRVAGKINTPQGGAGLTRDRRLQLITGLSCISQLRRRYGEWFRRTATGALEHRVWEEV